MRQHYTVILYYIILRLNVRTRININGYGLYDKNLSQ